MTNPVYDIRKKYIETQRNTHTANNLAFVVSVIKNLAMSRVLLVPI